MSRADLVAMAKKREKDDVAAGRVRRILQANDGLHQRIADCSHHMTTTAAALQVYCTNHLVASLPEAGIAKLLVRSVPLLFMRPAGSERWAFSSEGAMLESLRRVIADCGTVPIFVWLTPVLPHGRTVVLVARDRKRSSPWLADALRAELDLPSYAGIVH